MTSSFHRYSGLLEHDFVSFETRAACARLIIDDARLKFLIARTRALGYEDGPLSLDHWRWFVQNGREALAQFDQAWSTFLANMTRETSDEDDDRLREAIFNVLSRFEDMLAEFPERRGLISW